MKLLYFIMGGLFTALFLSNFMENYVDTMEKLKYNMVNDAYYIGCREAGGTTVSCNEKANKFTEPIKMWNLYELHRRSFRGEG